MSYCEKRCFPWERRLYENTGIHGTEKLTKLQEAKEP